METILICEDEAPIRGFISINLKRFGYEVIQAASGEEAIELFSTHPDISVCLLDVNLPGINGFDVCSAIRQQSETVGIIMLTARIQEVDKVHGLMTGADDYVNKPFSPTELIARIQSLVRRMNVQGREESITSSSEMTSRFELLPHTKQVKKDKQPIDLTPTEYEILSLLMKHKGEPFNRNDLLDEVWGLNYAGDTKIVDVNIRRLRQKIEDDPSNPLFIMTVWGYGYQWNEDI